MKFKLQMLATLFAIAFPLMASAQEEGKDRAALRKAMQQRAGSGPEVGGFPGGPMGMLKMLPIMKVLDSDQDGTLSASEIANASKALIQLDKNGDGIISAEEMRPDVSATPGGFAGAEPGPPNGPMLGKLFETRDKNGDGKLSGDEIPERLRDKMKMVDKDGDGSISKSEFTSVAARMEDGGGKRPDKGGKTGGAVKPKRPTE